MLEGLGNIFDKVITYNLITSRRLLEVFLYNLDNADVNEDGKFNIQEVFFGDANSFIDAPRLSREEIHNKIDEILDRKSSYED